MFQFSQKSHLGYGGYKSCLYSRILQKKNIEVFHRNNSNFQLLRHIFMDLENRDKPDFSRSEFSDWDTKYYSDGI